jgi:hypothetical protein
MVAAIVGLVLLLLSTFLLTSVRIHQRHDQLQFDPAPTRLAPPGWSP